MELDLINRKGMEIGWNEEMKKTEKELMEQLEAREKQEALYWQQKARVKWLKEGERNTKFFHNSVIQNKNNSRIQKLKKRDGNRVETRREIEAELTQHFSEILREDGGGRSRDIEQITA